MTSPYLQRPKRSLHEAIRDTGRSPDELGINGVEVTLPPHTPASRRKGSFRLTGYHLVLGAVICTGLLTGGILMNVVEQHQAPVAERSPEMGSDIVPASGPPDTGSTQDEANAAPAIDSQNWGSAPELAPLKPATGATD